jgi:hypothetical protein
VLPLLESDFVLGWKNIEKEDYVGSSFGYSRKDTSVGTTNGAGPHNIQIFVLSPDLVVLHALPGFWHPEDLARELRLAQVLARLWQDDQKTRAQKNAMFARLQRGALRGHPPVTFARSEWQPFDVTSEVMRAATAPRDTVLLAQDGTVAYSADGRPKMKPINVLVHERMAERPFVPFDEFDVATFIDYGREFYDNNGQVDGRGKKFTNAERLRAKRQKAERREAERARKRG